MLKVLFLIILNLIFTDAYALENAKVTLSGPNEIQNIENIVVYIESNSENVLGISSNIVYDKTKLNLVSYYGNSNYEMTVGNSIVLDTDKKTDSNSKVGTLIFKATNNFKSGESTIIKLVDIVTTDGVSERVIEGSEIVLSLNNKIQEGLLTEITINGERIKNFDSRIREYFVTIPNTETIDVSAKAINNKVIISGVGTQNIKDISKIIVKADNNEGLIEEYVINLYKEVSTESDEQGSNVTIKGLKSLDIFDYNIDFDNDVYEYFIDVSNDVEELEIFALPINDGSVVKISNNKLIPGENKILIEVFEHNGEITNYYINVNRGQKNYIGYFIVIVIFVLVAISSILLFNKKKKTKNMENIDSFNINFPKI